MKKRIREVLSKYRGNQGYTMKHAESELLNLFSVSQRSELLAFKQFISKTPLTELELYSDEEFTDLYIKDNCS